jgi:hypothetical protein
MMKQFRELLQSMEWGFYVASWKRKLLQSKEANGFGFDSEPVVEGAITAFVNAVIDERITRFAYDTQHPHLVTFDGTVYHKLQLPDWKKV